MIYSTLNFVIPVKKYWREKRKKNWILARTNMSSFPYAIICRKNGAWKFILRDNENACVDRSNNVLEDPRGRSSRVQQRFERSWNRSVTLPSFRSNLLFIRLPSIFERESWNETSHRIHDREMPWIEKPRIVSIRREGGERITSKYYYTLVWNHRGETWFSNGCIWRLINVRLPIDREHTYPAQPYRFSIRAFSRVHAPIVIPVTI